MAARHRLVVVVASLATAAQVGAWTGGSPFSLAPRVLRAHAQLLGAKKQKSHFEPYEIADRELAAGIFPPPERRDAVRVHKKHMPEGAAATKAPEGWLRQSLPSLEPPPSKSARLLHLDPAVLVVDDFMPHAECDRLMELARSGEAYEVQSATFSALTASARTSTTWYVHHTEVPELVGRVCELTGVAPSTLEEPQIVRYRVGQRFGWHFDEVPKAQLENGGQRLATLLVYLCDVPAGGGTAFRDLSAAGQPSLSVQPRKGRALLFFPAAADGTPDDRTLHAGEPVLQGEKWIAQLWLHERAYEPRLPPDARPDAAEAAQRAYEADCAAPRGA